MGVMPKIVRLQLPRLMINPRRKAQLWKVDIYEEKRCFPKVSAGTYFTAFSTRVNIELPGAEELLFTGQQKVWCCVLLMSSALSTA